MSQDFPSFAQTVPANGYQWWYFDATSDDGKNHLVVIAFVGSVFSPFYKRAVTGKEADPMDYCAINVALYSHPRTKARWVMSEVRIEQVNREAHRFDVSGTSLNYDGSSLVIDVNERAAPIPVKVQGRIKIHPQCVNTQEFALEASKKHHWWPYSPSTRVEVNFDKPGLSWSGNGYFDSNRGAEPLHEGFNSWHWSRTHFEQHTQLAYNALDRADTPSSLAFRINRSGDVEHTAPFSEKTLPPSPIWRAPRAAHVPDTPIVARSLEDTPFYARSILSNSNPAQPATMHESLCLKRFRSTWVTTLIPFRMRFPFTR